MASKTGELSIDQLRRACDPGQFRFKSTEELPPLEGVIGQDRAVRSVGFGIEIQSPGYHMYALGPVGTGKLSTVKKFLEKKAVQQPTPDDWCYVNDFDNPDRPRALRLPAGKGCQLDEDMEQLVQELKKAVPRAFETDEYDKEQERLEQDLQKRRQALLEELESEANSKGFTLLQSPGGIVIAPVVRGKVLTAEEYARLDEGTRRKMEARQQELQEHLRETLRRVQQLEKEAKERVRDLDRDVVGFAVGHLIDELEHKYAEFEPVVDFLKRVRSDILDSVQTFKQLQELEQARQQLPFLALQGGGQPSFDQYHVNLIVNHCNSKGAPVIIETNPTYYNLMGRIEHQAQFGALVTNFSMIKGGALHRANGGYLVVNVRDVLTNPFVWEGLKRALKNKEIKIETMGEAYQLLPTRSLDPEPIPLDVKVVLIGDSMLYYLLYGADEEFREVFKVKADFAVETDWADGVPEQYAQFIGAAARDEGLLHADPTGVAKIVEQASRMVENQKKLGTRFGDITDLVRQASYWAAQSGHKLITAEDVQKAVDEKTYRSNQIEERLREMIEEGTILIDTEGEVAGQVNGLFVMPMGDYMFGMPSRITARTYVGNAGVVNIDREVKLGGPIHNKGTMILSGYLGGKYALDIPMSLTASLTFEQTYEEIEGDSASSTELYTLLSSLSGFPVRQDFAVTGSVNQRGQVQAIGGVNEKIEGFFRICKAKGLTGSQGVMIPESNVKNLMLRDEVIQAVKDGKFHLRAVSTIDEGIEWLTGKPAGERQPDGTYPEGTVNWAVQNQLKALAEKAREFAKEEEGENGEGES